MSELSSSQRPYLRLVLLFSLIGLLVAIVLAARSVEFSATDQPLYPGDSMAAWKTAAPARKQATAREVIEILKHEQQIGPRTASAFESPLALPARVDELVAILDKATDRNQLEYASPNQSILRTTETLLGQLGWNE